MSPLPIIHFVRLVEPFIKPRPIGIDFCFGFIFESLRLAHVKLVMSDYAFFEYRAKITCTSHETKEGERVHCLLKIPMAADYGHRQRDDVELKQDAGDMILFTLNPGPHHKISHSEIWKVTENRISELGEASNLARVGDCSIYLYAS